VLTGAAYIAGFVPFTDKEVITGIGTVKKRYSENSKSIPADGTSPAMVYCFVGNY
jgi:hypothetical protein